MYNYACVSIFYSNTVFPIIKSIIKSRDLRPSKRQAISTYLEQVNVHSLVRSVGSCEEKVTMLETIINIGLEFILPLRKITVLSNEPPWVTSSLKDLIKRRQMALNRGDTQEFKYLRNQVNRARKVCRAKYYEAKVKHLKEGKASKWWKEVKKLSGMTSVYSSREQMFRSLGNVDELWNVTTSDLANIINEAFLSPMSDFSSLSQNVLIQFDAVSPESVFTVTTHSVFMKLSQLNPSKANGPDGIPSWLLKENASLLAHPVKEVLDSSYREGHLPQSWKKADITPLAKQKPVKDINKHLRPISLTPILYKVAEDFVVESFVKPAVMKQIDSKQFGTIPQSSTTHALISMIHTWNKQTDGNGSAVRVVLFDFKKAFDLIDHSILVEKLMTFDIPHSIIKWIVDFLIDRKQRVKLSQDCYSEWGAVPAGVPKGTKLGPWLFAIMIDDLNVTDANFWKYVDDTTISELVDKHELSRVQSLVDELTEKAKDDKFQLNEAKCKELCISFARSERSLSPILINNKPIEVVSNAKILGVSISKDLKWNIHIVEIVKKASSRLYFLRQLKRAKINEKDLLTFYLTCVRPVTEYACPVFHNSLPLYLSEELEKLQKRALRIIYPTLSYPEALSEAKIDTLFDRRELMTKKLFEDVIDNTEHRLHELLPNKNKSLPNLRRKNYFNVPTCKTNRFRDSFIIHNSRTYK